MQLNSFLAEVKHRAGIVINKSVILFFEPCELYDLDTNTVIAKSKRRGFDETILDVIIGGSTLRQIIESWEHLPIQPIRGGNGSGSNFTQTGFPAGGNKNESGFSGKDFPSRFNIDVKSAEKTLEEFRKKHADSDIEHGITVDERGFTTQYIHGSRGSVAIAGNNNDIIYHNHPSGGWPIFSREDLLIASTENVRGIVASSGLKGRDATTSKYAGDYKFTKTNKFDAKGFIKALNTAKISGKDLNDGSTKWLKANQKKYGYKFSFTKAKA